MSSTFTSVSSERLPLSGHVTVFHCPRCSTDTLTGRRLSPFLERLEAEKILRWEDHSVSFHVGERTYSLTNPGEYHFIFNGTQVIISKNSDSEPTSGRKFHETICGTKVQSPFSYFSSADPVPNSEQKH